MKENLKDASRKPITRQQRHRKDDIGPTDKHSKV
jgi:hypothetical protein